MDRGLGAAVVCPARKELRMFDCLITGGSVVDGTGAPRRHADVAIRDGRIAAVGRPEGPAKKTIDAGGRIVAPGVTVVWTNGIRLPAATSSTRLIRIRPVPRPRISAAIMTIDLVFVCRPATPVSRPPT